MTNSNYIVPEIQDLDVFLDNEEKEEEENRVTKFSVPDEGHADERNKSDMDIGDSGLISTLCDDQGVNMNDQKICDKTDRTVYRNDACVRCGNLSKSSAFSCCYEQPVDMSHERIISQNGAQNGVCSSDKETDSYQCDTSRKLNKESDDESAKVVKCYLNSAQTKPTPNNSNCNAPSDISDNDKDRGVSQADTSDDISQAVSASSKCGNKVFNDSGFCDDSALNSSVEKTSSNRNEVVIAPSEDISPSNEPNQPPVTNDMMAEVSPKSRHLKKARKRTAEEENAESPILKEKVSKRSKEDRENIVTASQNAVDSKLLWCNCTDEQKAEYKKWTAEW